MEDILSQMDAECSTQEKYNHLRILYTCNNINNNVFDCLVLTRVIY